MNWTTTCLFKWFSGFMMFKTILFIIISLFINCNALKIRSYRMSKFTVSSTNDLFNPDTNITSSLFECIFFCKEFRWDSYYNSALYYFKSNGCQCNHMGPSVVPDPGEFQAIRIDMNGKNFQRRTFVGKWKHTSFNCWNTNSPNKQGRN